MNTQSRKVKGAGIILALMLVVLSAKLFMPMPFSTDCRSTVFSEIASPDGDRRARVLHYVCQANKSSEVMVHISAMNNPHQWVYAFCAPVPFESEFSPRTVPISTQWVENKELIVSYESALIPSCSTDTKKLGIRVILNQSSPKRNL